MRKLLLPFVVSILSLSVLGQPTQPKLILPIGHTGFVESAVFSPDGKKVLTASWDNTAKIWDSETGKLLQSLEGHTNRVRSAVFSLDGKKVLTASRDSTAKIWDSVTGKLLQSLEGHISWVNSAQFSTDGKKVLTASGDNTSKIWDSETGKLLQRLEGHAKSVYPAVFSPDGKKVLTASMVDNTAKIWDSETEKLLQSLEGHRDGVRSAVFSPDGKKVLTASEDNSAKIWDSETGKPLQSLKGHTRDVNSAVFSPDGKKVLTASMDNTAKIWDSETGKLLQSLVGHTIWVNLAVFSPDGKKVLTASWDKTAKIWDSETGKLLQSLEGHTDWVTSAVFSPDGKKVLTLLRYATAKIWDSETGNLLQSLQGHTYHVNSLVFSSDGKKVLTASGDSTAKIWDSETGKLLQSLEGHRDGVKSAEFSPDGKKVLTASEDKTAKIWDSETGKLLQSLEGHTSRVNSAVFSADWKKVLTSSWDNTAKIWDSETGKLLQSLEGHTAALTSAVFSPDGKKVLTASFDETAKIWDSETGKLLQSLEGHNDFVMSAKFNPDGKKVLTGSWDKTAKIWDTETGKLLQNLKRHAYNVASAQFSPDGKKVLTKSWDGTAKIGDSKSGKLLQSLKGHTRFVRSAVFSADGKKVLTASADNTAKIWDSVTGKLLQSLEGHAQSVNSAVFSADGKKVLTASADNTCKMWDAEKGKLLYTFFAVDSSDYLVLDEHYRYDGTPGARDYLYFVCGNEIIDLAQMKDALYVPGLVEKIMSGEEINYPKLSELDVCEALPIVEQLESGTSTYRYKITPRKLGLEQVEVYVNDKRIFTFSKRELAQQGADYMLELSEAQLNPHFIAGEENKIRVIGTVITKEGNELKSRGVVQVSSAKDGEQLSPLKLFAVMVGVNEYKDPDLKLNYPAKDAQELGRALKLSASKLLGPENVFFYPIYTGSGNTERFSTPEKEGIRKALEDIGKKARPEDVIVLFFAGHGVMQGADEKLFTFLTAEASNLNLTGINTKELQEWLSYEGPHKILANKSILIFDACNSGQATKELMALARSDDDTRRIRQVEDLKDKSGMFILAASAANQAAYELPQYEQGLLTYSMLSVLKSNPDILDAGGCLNVQKWFLESEKYLKNLVESHGYKQDAQPFGTANICIGNVDEEVRNGIVLAKEKPLVVCANVLNMETFSDDLEIKNLVNTLLSDIAEKSAGSQVAFARSEISGANQINISYKVNGTNIQCDVSLVKDKKALHKVKISGTKDELNVLAKKIVEEMVKHAR